MEEYVVRVYGSRTEWLNKDGQLHRTDGPAVECIDGSKEWFINWKRHRVDGPAIELLNGFKAWYQHDKLHRIDGPAVELVDGGKQWWIEGREYTEEDFYKKLNPIMELTVDEISKRLGFTVKVVGEK
jgi:hypothetical protein